MPLIDTSTKYGQRVQRRLDTEIVIWLVTQGTNGTPQPSPVWFLPDGDDELVIYSQRDKPKLRNIAANPTVALAFNTSPDGDDVVVFHGEARIDHDAPSADAVPAYVEKYGRAIAALGYDPATFAAEYPVPVRVKLTKLRGF
jgi:PPOX class probable F420-dependent enzyme